MIGTSKAEYLFIRGSILFLHNIAPASLLYCALLLLSPRLLPAAQTYRAPFPIEAWLLAEAVFYLLIFLPNKYLLQRSAIHPDLPCREERELLFKRCNANVTHPERYLSRWFFGARIEDIKRENVKEFFRWAFLNTGDTREEDEKELEGYVTATEKLLGKEIPPGRGNARSLRLTLDKVDFWHRSLLWYFCIGVVDTIMSCRMFLYGFHFHRSSLAEFFTVFPFRPLTLLSAKTSPVKHLTYWHRPHSSKTRLPVLFVHGIGVGLYPYTNLLRDLNKAGEACVTDGEVGIIALEIMPVSSRMTSPVLEKDVMMQEIQTIVRHHGWDKFVLVSHSYGSIISTHLLKSPLTAPLIGPLVFLDPVSFLLHLPDVAYNFTAREPIHANEHQMWYFGSKDMGVAHALGRKFFWSENIVWKEDLGLQPDENGRPGRDVTVVLSGKDLIVDTDAVRRYLLGTSSKASEAADDQAVATTGTGQSRVSRYVARGAGAPETGSGKLEVLWYHHLDHAQVFDTEVTRQPVIKAIGASSGFARG